MSTQKSLFPTVSFIGLGLIGGSLAKLIRHQLPESRIYALDKPEITELALKEGVITQSLTALSDSNLHQSDLIIIATHLEEGLSTLSQLDTLVSHPVSVMDISSTKTSICERADTLSDNIRFIGGHPLAGREISGYQNSCYDLFLGKRFLLSPCKKTSPDFETQIICWLRTLGMEPVVLDSEAHDKLMSLVSHFPQFYAIALANLLNQHNPEKTLHFLGGGIDDQMRLMASPFDMWGDIFKDNKIHLNQVLEEFIHILEQMKTALQNDTLTEWFENSHTIYHCYQAHQKRHQ